MNQLKRMIIAASVLSSYASADVDVPAIVRARDDLKVVELVFETKFDPSECDLIACSHLVSAPNSAVPAEIWSKLLSTVPVVRQIRTTAGRLYTFTGGLNGYSVIPQELSVRDSDPAALEEAAKAAPKSFSVFAVLRK